MSMQVDMFNVTPALAREWLRKNTNNRPIRPSHVITLKQSFERGEFVTTHQGLAFDDDGVLLDGQHRLTAIAQMDDNQSFPMLVTRGLSRDAAFAVIDATQAKRTVSDVLSISRDVSDVANVFARLHKQSGSGLTPAYVKPFALFAQNESLELTAFCKSKTRTWSSAPVRAAGVLWMKMGQPDYVKAVYRTLVSANFEEMPRIAQALFRAQLVGKVQANNTSDMLVRCMRVFDPAMREHSKIQIKDVNVGLGEIRDTLRALMKSEGLLK